MRFDMECPHIPIESYGNFSHRLYDQAVNRRIPITGSIEVTAHCNLKCVHCYIPPTNAENPSTRQELSIQQICNIIDQVVEAGCLSILFTGGEPFIRPDFLDIYIYAKKKGLLITLFSNGTTITPEVADCLARWRPFAIEISLYGSTPDTVEKITGTPGSFQKCKNGIELLIDRKLPLRLKSMIMTLNHHELKDMKTYARELGVEFRFDPILNLKLDGSKGPEAFRLSPREVVALDLDDDKRIKNWHQYLDRFSGPPPHPQYLYQCGAGVTTFHIDAFGELSPCLMSRNPSYDLLKGSFRDAWDRFILSQRTRKWNPETPCKNCDIISLCGQCPGIAQLENGNPELMVNYLCQIAHLRATEFGFDKCTDGENIEKRNRKEIIPTTI